LIGEVPRHTAARPPSQFAQQRGIVVQQPNQDDSAILSSGLTLGIAVYGVVHSTWVGDEVPYRVTPPSGHHLLVFALRSGSA